MPKASKRQAIYEQLLAAPVDRRLQAAAALVDDPRPSFRALLLPLLEHTLRELREDPKP